MLDRKQAYDLTEDGKIMVGRKNANPEAQIVLGGIGVQKNHAFFEVDGDGNAVLNPFNSSCKDDIKINGQKIAGPTILNHGDRVVFGTSNAFLYRDPEKNPEDLKEDVDFDFIANEINDVNEQERSALIEAKNEEEEKQKQKLEEEYKVERAEAEAKAEEEKQAQEAQIKRLETEMNREQEESEKERLQQEIAEKEAEQK